MAMNTDGTMNGTRPNQPTAGNYAAPQIMVADLKDQAKYAAAPPAQTLPLALHHVIPWEYLWNFWNGMVANKYYGAARDYLALFGFAKATTGRWTTDMDRNTFVDPTLGEIESNICWWKWNLVRGPQHRTSATQDGQQPGVDPGAAVDDMHWRAGDAAPRIKKLADIGKFIHDTTGKLQRPDSAKYVSEKDLSTVIRSWSSLAREKLIEFNPDMWRIETKSPDYFNPGGGGVITHPRWHKLTRD
jgi:hypothetical protein